MHDVDVLDGYAEGLRHQLREGRLVPLAVAVRPGEHGDRAGGMHAHLGRLEETGAGP